MEAITVLILAVIFGIILIFLLDRFGSVGVSRREANKNCHELTIILNSNKWKTGFISLLEEVDYPFLNGIYNARKIKCVYKKDFKIFLNIYSVPNSIPKKIPLFKYRESYPSVYKDIIFNGRYLLSQTVLKYYHYLSKEEAIAILDDLVHACEMVERGEYEV
jgi:hypothetical protein